MSKKQLKARVRELEHENANLKGQILALETMARIEKAVRDRPPETNPFDTKPPYKWPSGPIVTYEDLCGSIAG